MKKQIALLLLLLVILTSCGNDDIEAHEIAENDHLIITDKLYVDTNEYNIYASKDDKFELKMYIEKGAHVANEHISVFSTFEYIGNEEEVNVYHPSTLFGYTLTDGEIEYSMNMAFSIQMYSKIEKNKLYIIPFVKSGGYSQNDENYDFMKSYYEDEQLRLPTGEYILKGICNFDLSVDGEYINSVTAKFSVN